MSAAARLSDVGSASCRRCGRHVGTLRTELSLVPGVRPALFWADAARQCTCPGTTLPRPSMLTSAVRVRVREVLAVAAGAHPWQELTARRPVDIVV